MGARQRVEILKLLFRDPRVLVLDEPTAVLAPQEVTWLFGVLRSLAREGRTVLLVAHKLDEVLSVADRVTVLRNGATVLTARREEVQASDLARAMVGHTPGGAPSREGASPGAEVARLEGVEAPGPRGEVALREVSLAVRRGEIVGVAGVEGNGQRELALVLSGRIPPTSGRAHLPARVGFIPQDRGTEGLIGDFDLAENVALAVHDDPEFRRGPLLSWERIREEADAVMERFGVRAPGWQVAARSLSGGNQQKLVVGRELRGIPDLLVAENPTRGLDIGATEFVHAELVDLARGRLQGAAPPGIVLLSTDLEEVLALSDRLFVMVRGSLLPVPPEDRSPEGVGSLMLSGARQS